MGIPANVNSLLHRISERIARLLEREGYLERDSEEGSLLLDRFDDDVINELQGSSITYRIAVGSQRGKKVFTLKTLPARDEEVDETNGQTLAKGGGFSLHAGVSAKSHQRDKVERLCRYIARPAVSTHRLERLPDGKLSYELKTPYKNGTTHVCRHCQGSMRIIACIEDRQVINKILAHINRKQEPFSPVMTGTGIRAPPADPRFLIN